MACFSPLLPCLTLPLRGKLSEFLNETYPAKTRVDSRYDTIRYDTIEEINVDSKAEYTA